MSNTNKSRGPHPDLEELQARGTFTIPSAPETDLYATPKRGYIFTSPIRYQLLPSKSFKSISATLSFTYKHLYDQGGLVIVLPTKSEPSPNDTNAVTRDTHPQWVKCGIEFEDGIPQLSVVEREEWADWSLGLLPSSAIDDAKKRVTWRIEMRRAGNSLLIYAMDPKGGGKERLIRKMQWVFIEENEGMWVGVYAASPVERGVCGGRELLVEFSGLEVKTSET